MFECMFAPVWTMIHLMSWMYWASWQYQPSWLSADICWYPPSSGHTCWCPISWDLVPADALPPRVIPADIPFPETLSQLMPCLLGSYKSAPRRSYCPISSGHNHSSSHPMPCLLRCLVLMLIQFWCGLYLPSLRRLWLPLLHIVTCCCLCMKVTKPWCFFSNVPSLKTFISWLFIIQ